MNSHHPGRSGHRLDAQAFAAVLLAMFVATGGFVLDAVLGDAVAEAVPQSVASLPAAPLP